MEIAALSTFGPVVPQDFEADPDAAGRQEAQEQGSAADDDGVVSTRSALKELLPDAALHPSIVLALQAKPQAQTAAPTAQATPQTTGTIGPPQGYLADLEGIAKSGLPVGDKLKMAWDTTKDHWSNSGMAHGTVQIPGGGVQVDENGCLSTQQGGPKICVGPAAIEEGIATSLAPAAERIAARMLAPEAAQAGETLASKAGPLADAMRGLETRGVQPLPGTRQIPKGIPDNWRIRPTRDVGGTWYYDPANKGNAVRVMQGDPASPFPNSQAPYVRWQQNGQALDINGSIVPKNIPDAHIPLQDFQFNPDIFKK